MGRLGAAGRRIAGVFNHVRFNAISPGGGCNLGAAASVVTNTTALTQSAAVTHNAVLSRRIQLGALAGTRVTVKSFSRSLAILKLGSSSSTFL
jgi:hypothetical protein